MLVRPARILCLALAVFSTSAVPQTERATPLKFDVASIKPIVPGSQIPGWPDHPNPGGREPARYTRNHLTLRTLIQIAYKLKPSQISGPAWLDSERFDLIAT